MKKWIKENKFNIIVMLILIITTSIIALHHENWRDEAQAWLIARDLSLAELLPELKNEGHFIIWYLILMPFAKLGFPYKYMSFISCFITWISAWIILKKSPFKNYMKLLFIFSFPMLYLCPIISRCYCIIPLALSLMAWFHKDRHDRPFRYVLSIALLANTHVIMLGVVGMTMLDFYVEEFINRKKHSKEENKKIIVSFIILAILLLLSALTILGTHCSLFGNEIEASEVPLQYLMYMINILVWNFPLMSIYEAFIIVVTAFLNIEIIMIASKYKIVKRYLFPFLASIIYQLTIYVFIFGVTHVRAGTIILMVMYYLWISYYEGIPEKLKKNPMEGKIIKWLFIIIMIMNIASGLFYISWEMVSDYSTAYKVGEYINENAEEGSILISGYQPEFLSSVEPYLTNNSKCYYLRSKEYFTFTIWDEYIYIDIKDSVMIERLKTTFEGNDNIYYVYSKVPYYENIDDKGFMRRMEKLGVFERVFETDNTLTSNETYIIFKINLENITNERTRWSR